MISDRLRFSHQRWLKALLASSALISATHEAHAQAVVTVNDGSTVTVPGPSFPQSTITTTAAGEGGMNAINGSTINANNVVIDTSGDVAVGIIAGSNSTINYNGGPITTHALTGTGSAASLGANVISGTGRIVLTGTEISTAGIYAYGVRVDNGTGVLDGATVSTTGDNASGVVANFTTAHNTVRNSNVQTLGTGASGIVSSSGSTTEISDTHVETRGNLSNGIFSTATGSGNGSHMTATNVTIETFGTGSIGASAFQSGSTLDMTGGTVTTHGTNAYGLSGQDSGVVTATSTAILTTGDGAFGVRAAATGVPPGVVNLINATVSTTGAGAHGLEASHGLVNADGTPVSTTGSAAHGLFALEGGTINYAGQTVTTSSPDSAGIAFGFDAVGVHSTINVTNATINPAGDGLLAPTGTNIATLTGSTLNAGSGIALDSMGQSITTFLADSSTINGSALTVSTAVMDVTMRNNTLWNMTGSSNVTSLINDNSLLAYSAPTGDPTLLASYKTMTTLNYEGINSRIGLNTYLNDDTAPSDRLVINGGAATGNTFLHFTDTGGPGALTTANGILVVDAINNATTTTDAFSMANPELRGGAYDYRLFRGGLNDSDPNNWFLRSTFVVEPPGPTPPEPPPPVVPPDVLPPRPPVPGPGTFPIIGPEIATYGVVQPMAQQLGRVLLGTHDERLGGLYFSARRASRLRPTCLPTPRLPSTRKLRPAAPPRAGAPRYGADCSASRSTTTIWPTPIRARRMARLRASRPASMFCAATASLPGTGIMPASTPPMATPMSMSPASSPTPPRPGTYCSTPEPSTSMPIRVGCTGPTTGHKAGIST